MYSLFILCTCSFVINLGVCWSASLEVITVVWLMIRIIRYVALWRASSWLLLLLFRIIIVISYSVLLLFRIVMVSYYYYHHKHFVLLHAPNDTAWHHTWLEFSYRMNLEYHWNKTELIFMLNTGCRTGSTVGIIPCVVYCRQSPVEFLPFPNFG